MLRLSIPAILLLSMALPVRSTATNAVKDSLDFDRSSADSPSALLSGRISGLLTAPFDGSLNGGYSTFIRGLNSLRGESEPLWIIDGMPLVSNGTDFNNLSFLNPYDIESIQVLKNISETAVYGAKGANGIVIITTRRMKNEGNTFEWNSNLGGIFPGRDGECFKNAFVHNHSFLLSSAKGQSSLNISANLKEENGTVCGTDKTYGGFHVSYDTKANPVVWFGVNTILSIGRMSDQGIGVLPGTPSLMAIVKDPSSFPDDTAGGWIKDYDNDAEEMRMVTSANLTLNFTKALTLKTTAGADYRYFTGYEWSGKGTSPGLKKNGIATIDTDASLRYELSSTLNWQRHFGKNQVKAYVGAGLDGDWIRADSMNGCDFFTHELRAKGLNIHADKTVLSNRSTDYFNWSLQFGADWNYDGRFGISAKLVPSNTPRYSSGAENFYSISAFAKAGSFLTFSAGFGKAGNEKNVPYPTFGKYLSFAYPDVEKELQHFYEGLNRIISKEFNLSADLTLFESRLNLSAEYFRKNTNDAFLAFCFGAKGDGTLWNWAERSDFFNISSGFLSSGAEFDFEAEIIKTQTVDWSVRADFTYNSISADGICEEDTVLAKDFTDLLPKFYGGIGSTFNFKGLSIDAACDYTSRYFRLRRISAGYTFQMDSESFLKAVRISLSAFNLFTASSGDSWNPIVCGPEYGTYPLSRSLVAGVNLKF